MDDRVETASPSPGSDQGQNQGPQPLGKRILLCGFGTQGDVQPIGMLARRLNQAGHDVLFLVNADYERLAATYEVPVIAVGRFAEVLRMPEVRAAWKLFPRKPSRLPAAAFRLYGALNAIQAEVLGTCAREVDRADLVIYNPLLYFAGVMAHDRGIPSVQVTYTPNFPNWRAATFFFGGGWNLGGPLNRLSYETARMLPLLTYGAVRRFRKASGRRHLLPAFMNPNTTSLAISTQLLAYSSALSPEPGSLPKGAIATGFWTEPRRSGARLPDHLTAFLAAGEAPVFISFGSVIADAERITRVVLEALASWGGRAILGAVGAGALKAPPLASPRIALVGTVDYDLLFPHVFGVVHHGGAGTTARVLLHGLPSVVAASNGEQLLWGRRLAAAGAAQAPLWLWRLRSQDLAARIANLQTGEDLRRNAARLASELAQEPGLAGAVAAVNALLDRGDGATVSPGSRAPPS